MFKAVTEFNGLTAANSHWCYSDVFEEWGLPGTHWPVKTAAYHGGFGIITIDGIHKPSYQAFSFLHQMGKNLVKTKVTSPAKEINAIATLDADKLAVAAWYWVDIVNKKEKYWPGCPDNSPDKNLPQSLIGKNFRAYGSTRTMATPLRMAQNGQTRKPAADQISQLKKLSDDTLRDPALDRRIDGSDLALNFNLPPAGVVFFVIEK